MLELGDVFEELIARDAAKGVADFTRDVFGEFGDFLVLAVLGVVADAAILAGAERC